MPGFISIINQKGLNKIIEKRDDLIIDSIEIEDDLIERRTVNKFLNDKIFDDTEEYFILTEGVILNSLELIEKYRGINFVDTVKKMYELNGETFFNEFRGSFSGVFFDKKKDIKLIYTDHIASKQVFYSLLDESTIIGSEINYITDLYKENNIKYTLNKKSSYFLLTYGYMFEDNTLFNEINKVMAGHYIKIVNNNFETKQFHQIDNIPNYKESEDEIIENVDRLFRAAIKRSFDKDREYGYKHLASLSGGLDSRMTTWVAHDMGYGDKIVNFTFSQSDYLDETIAKHIASDLKHEWIFKSLDNGLFLKEIDDTIQISSGRALYYTMAHNKSCLNLIDKTRFGILHTGMIGDASIGTYYSSLNTSEDFDIEAGAFSEVLKFRLDKSMFKTKYDNEEMFKFYGRGFNGVNQSIVVVQEFSETYSPFYDLEFMEYCLHIPVELRIHHSIYKKWIIKKYPESTKYIWEKTGGKITEKNITILGRNILFSKLFKRAMTYGFRKMGFNTSSSNTKNHMNPLDYYYNNNDDLKEYINNYYKDNINLLDFDKELKLDCINMFENHTNIEKNQVITLLGVMKRYFR